MNVRATDFVYQTVSDIETLIPFYRDTLGLALEESGGGFAEFALPPTTLVLGEESQMPTTPGDDGTGIALAVEDVESAIEELSDEGVPIYMEPMEFEVCHMAMVADPDGNVLTLHARKDGTAGRVNPFP